MIKYLIRKYSKRKILLFTGDVFFLLLSSLIALSFIFHKGQIQYVNAFENIFKLILYLLICFVTLLSFRYLLLYKERTFFSGSRSIVAIAKAVLISAIILIIFNFFVKYEELTENSRFSLILFMFSSFILVFGFRYIFTKLSRDKEPYHVFNRNIIAIGAGRAGEVFANELKNISGYLKLVGFIDDDESKTGKSVNNVKVLGKLEDINKIVDEYSIDEIFVTIKSISYENLMRIIEKAKPTRCQINLLSPHFGVVEEKFESKEYMNLSSVPINTPVTTIYSVIVKRILDIMLTSILLALSLPFFILFGIVIKLTSKGPVFYKTNVIGKEGEEFVWYKFRTMLYESDDEIHKTHLKEIINGNKSVEKLKNDVRITFIGKFLRKYSLDELPQLINVMKGDMSLIGPRPCLPYEFELMQNWHKRRTKVIPGMSGLWQIAGRNKDDVSFNDSLILDLYYVDNISFWLDLKIIIKTIPVVLLGKGGS